MHLEEEEEDICEAQSTCVIRSKLEIVVNFKKLLEFGGVAVSGCGPRAVDLGLETEHRRFRISYAEKLGA